MSAPADQDHRPNNLDALRIIGALLVIFGHAYALLGRGAELPTIWGYPVQAIGVIIFFSISGYLVAASWGRTKNLLAYTMARALRIFPALIVVVLVTVLAIGPAVTELPRADYFTAAGTWDYVVNNLRLHAQFGLPGVWGDLPYPGAVNGSLWTLFVEIMCYLVVPLHFIVPRALRPLGALMVVVLLIPLAQTPAQESVVFYGVGLPDAAGVAVYFAGGVFLHVASKGLFAGRRIPFRTDVAVTLMATYTLLAASEPQHALKLGWFVLPYAVLTIGLARTPYVSRAARFGDFSYGLYLWAFPVQQLVIDQWGVQQLAVDLVLVTVLALVPAVLSWYLVERPSLLLKDRILARLTTSASPRHPASAATSAPVPASAPAS